MIDKTNTAFSQQQRTQISNACERVQNTININNSTLVELNAALVRKADEIAIKWRAYGLPYNAMRDAVIEMAIWQKQQMMKDAVNGIMDCDDDNEWIEITDKLIVTPSRAGKKVKIYIIKEDEQ